MAKQVEEPNTLETKRPCWKRRESEGHLNGMKGAERRQSITLGETKRALSIDRRKLLNESSVFTYIVPLQCLLGKDERIAR